MHYLDRYTQNGPAGTTCAPTPLVGLKSTLPTASYLVAEIRPGCVYVDHVSFRRGLKVLALTAWKIVKRGGISQPGQVAVEELQGIKEAVSGGTRT